MVMVTRYERQNIDFYLLARNIMFIGLERVREAERSNVEMVRPNGASGLYYNA